MKLAEFFPSRKGSVVGALLCVNLLPACSVTDALYTTGGAAAGAAVGGLVGQQYSGNPAAPVIGAAAGAALGGIGTALAVGSVKKGKKAEYAKGYDRGASDAVKRQYWILQNLQKDKRREDFPYRLTLYRFTVQPDPQGPVKKVPEEIAIPIYE